MNVPGDPYRILGIAPGASLNEIRSAYRRLVKQYHPDAAGERALPRFLAIQAAYERLVDAEGRLRPTAAGGGRRPSDPSRADPARARASREAWRARRAGSASGRPGTSTSRPGPSTSRPGTSTSRPGPGAAGSSSSGPGTTGGAADSSGRAGTGTTSPGQGAAGGQSRERPRRGFRKATPGSTTYDEAAEIPRDPEWEGGSWYGPSSRTYWTINPREYADPRKHGPEYQARARRAAVLEDAAAPAAEGSAATSDAGGTEPTWAFDGSPSATAADDAGFGRHGWAYEASVSDDPPPSRPPRDARGSSQAWTGDGAAESLPDLEAIARKAAPAHLLGFAHRRGVRGRLVVALVAWPPIGYAVGSLLSTVTGCAQFSPGCPDALPLLSLAVQPLLVIALMALPPVSAVGAFATLVALAVAVPVAAVLSLGTGPEGGGGKVVFGLAVAVAYLVSMVAGAIAIWRLRPDLEPPRPPGPPDAE